MANNNGLPKLKHFDGTSFLSQEEIQNMGFASVGSKVHISRKASFYSPQNIHIGENVRIDDFCLLSGEITIGSNIHIAAYSCLMGQKGIILHDFSQISTRVTILSATDDFSGKYLVGPQVPSGYRNVEGGIVVLERHSLIGAGSIIFLGEEDVNRIGQFVFGTDGSGAPNLMVPAGGMALPRSRETAKEESDKAGNVRSANNLYMNGPEIFSFTLRAVPDLIKKTLKKNNLTMSDIDCFIFHQANKFILESLRDKLEIPHDRFVIDVEEVGNTVSSTIPIALQRSLEQGIINKGDKVLIAGFGVGYSLAATVLSV